MKQVRKLTLAVAAAALAITALGAPAMGADDKGTLVIVNGRPGTKVDICIGNKELASKVPYGGYFRKNVIATGGKMLKFYKKDPRTCAGTLLAKKYLNVVANYDKTIVLTKDAPKVVMFDNYSPQYSGEIPPQGAASPFAYLNWLHAADLPANFLYTLWEVSVPETPWFPNAKVLPAVNVVWVKGDRYFQPIAGDTYIATLRATKPEDPETLAEKTALMKVSRRYEWVLLGTSAANAKMIVIDRGVSLPSP
jgi:hypothetical protein